MKVIGSVFKASLSTGKPSPLTEAQKSANFTVELGNSDILGGII